MVEDSKGPGSVGILHFSWPPLLILNADKRPSKVLTKINLQIQSHQLVNLVGIPSPKNNASKHEKTKNIYFLLLRSLLQNSITSVSVSLEHTIMEKNRNEFTRSLLKSMVDVEVTAYHFEELTYNETKINVTNRPIY